MKKKIVFGLITTSNDYYRGFQHNEQLYKEIIKNFGSFLILDLSNLLLGRKVKQKKRRNNLPKKIKIFKPKNGKELISYFNEKKFIGFNNIGKTFSFFKIYFFLNKINFDQIFILNFGYLDNVNTVDFTKFNNFLYSNLNFILRKLSKYIFRVFSLINFFPQIEYYFDSSLPTINNIKNSWQKKIDSRFNINISFFKNAHLINSKPYDYVQSFKKKLNEKYIVFIDTDFNHGDRVIREGKINNQEKNQYQNHTLKLFKYLEKKLKKKVVICLHPKNNDKNFQVFFKNYEIKKFKTEFYIKNAFLVLFHTSSAIMSATLLDKKILSVKSRLLGNYLSNLTDLNNKQLGTKSIYLKDKYNFINKGFFKSFKKNKNSRNKYVRNYLNSDGITPGYIKVVKILKRRYFRI